MKRGMSLVLAAVLALAIGASANADSLVWAESGGAGAQGATLVIDRLPGGSDTYTISFVHSSNPPLSGASVDLFSNDSGLSATAAMLTTTWEIPDTFTLGNSPGNLITLAGGAQLFGAPKAGGGLFDITIDLNDPVGAVGATWEISAKIGGGTFSEPGGTVFPVFFGASNSVPGSPLGGVGDVPVVIIRNIPEPATMALLGVGLLGLIRRRR